MISVGSSYERENFTLKNQLKADTFIKYRNIKIKSLYVHEGSCPGFGITGEVRRNIVFGICNKCGCDLEEFEKITVKREKKGQVLH